MKLFANIVSIVFHPLLMVTYGMLLALGFTYLGVYPLSLKLYLVGGVFLSTVVIPGIIITLMIKSGAADDMELTDRRERLIPYLLFIASNMVCFCYLFKMQLPFWILSMFMGVCVALFAALCINFVWKISIHALGIGGLFGAIMGIARMQMLNPYWLFIIVLIVAGLVGTARIILNKHTPMQVYAGFLLGLACTFGISLTSFIYLLI
ncbi:MAG: phosphatase PAP2 family protein [Tannerellaceae bacterium]|jgi:membrane-associated phospholipid phosphatase|nr:phosphatase PAP2 family protein [Tannerellaceae bacterium]